MADFELGQISINAETLLIQDIGNKPAVLGQLTKAANATAAACNAASAGFRTRKVKKGTKLPDGTIAQSDLGGKRPNYLAKKAQRGQNGAVALVVTGNYAAQKDQARNNTMIKNMRAG